jgi:peptide/nickel transport system substrate-binding protein
MDPTDGQQAMYDQSAVAELQWDTKPLATRIEDARKLLDDAGYKDVDGDGLREDPSGAALAITASCPSGWSDWEASMEIVAAAGASIGLNLTTNYPTWEDYQTIFTNTDQTEFDIFMYAGDSAGVTYPWNRVRQRMSSEFLHMQGNWSGNWGSYSNPRADEIVAAIPLESDPAKLKELYTEAVKIYLTDVPSFALMYRPEVFHAVNESVWTGFPEQGDGLNIPPMDCTDGYGIAALYHVANVQ